MDRRLGRAGWVVAVAAALVGEGKAAAACGDGGVAWVRQLSSTLDLSLSKLAATPDGGVVAAVTFKGELRLDGIGPKPLRLEAGGGTASIVLKLSPSGGLAWMRRLTGVDDVTAVAVQSDGSVVVGGSFRRRAALDGTPDHPVVPFPSDVPNARLYLGFYGPDGTPRAARVVADTTRREPLAVAIRRLVPFEGGVAIAGNFTGQLLVGDEPRQTRLRSRGASDVYLATVHDDGSPGWAVRVGGEGEDYVGPLAVSGDGAFLISGKFTEKGAAAKPSAKAEPGATIGEAPAPVLHATGATDAFLARFGADGRLAWAQAIGGGLGDILPAADGGALITGIWPLPARSGRGGGSVAAAGRGARSLLGHLSRDGGVGAAFPLGNVGVQRMASLPGGDVMLVGSLDDSVRYPAAGSKRVTLTSAGHSDALVARHGPDGALRWATHFGGIGDDYAVDVTVDAAGAVTVSGHFDRDFTVGEEGCHPLHVAESDRASAFLARLAPGAALSDEAHERRLVETKVKVKALKTSAARAYKAKHYDTACPLFQTLVELQPDDPPAMTDLAVCLQRLGRLPEAVAANRKAIALAAKTDISDHGDEATRRHAYFNLGKLGEVVKVPEARCAKLVAAPGCARSLWACPSKREDQGSSGGATWNIVRIGITEDDAEIGADEELPCAMPSLDGWEATDGPFSDAGRNWSRRASSVDVLVGETTEAQCHQSENDDSETIKCQIVTADACLGLVGTTCTKGKAPAKTTVDEFYLYQPER